MFNDVSSIWWDIFENMKKKKTYTAADRSIFWIQNKALDGIPRRHLALLYVTRGGALRSDLWSGDQAGEGPSDCWRLHSPPSCRSHRGNLHTKLHILNGQHHGQNFLSIRSLSQVANLGILTRYLSNKTIWFFSLHILKILSKSDCIARLRTCGLLKCGCSGW